MNTATQNLENDHVYILRLTDIMLAMVEKRSTDTNHFELVTNLIRNFADGLHHAKEEDLLFPLLEEKGFSPENGPVAVMLHEHEQGRNYVKGASNGIEDFKKGNAEALQSIYDNLSAYAILLKGHIDKENNAKRARLVKRSIRYSFNQKKFIRELDEAIAKYEVALEKFM